MRHRSAAGMRRRGGLSVGRAGTRCSRPDSHPSLAATALLLSILLHRIAACGGLRCLVDEPVRHTRYADFAPGLLPPRPHLSPAQQCGAASVDARFHGEECQCQHGGVAETVHMHGSRSVPGNRHRETISLTGLMARSPCAIYRATRCSESPPRNFRRRVWAGFAFCVGSHAVSIRMRGVLSRSAPSYAVEHPMDRKLACCDMLVTYLSSTTVLHARPPGSTLGTLPGIA